MSAPLVSVVIPTYNRAGMVSEAIDSALGQTYKHVEIIIVDDGSTDRTPEVLETYGSSIHVIRQANAGASAARNRGIAAARGEIIAFLDSDDLWLPTKIERQVHALEQAGPAVVCCWCNTIMQRPSGDKQRFFDLAKLHPAYSEGIWLNVAEVISQQFVLFNQAVAVRRSALDRAGTFDENLWVMEDQDLALRLAMLGPWAYIEESLVIWRGGSQHSLYEQAYKQPVRMHECVISICQKALANPSVDSPRTRRRLARELHSARSDLVSTRLRQRNQLLYRGLGRAIAFTNKARNAVLARLCGRPAMRVVPLGT